MKTENHQAPLLPDQTTSAFVTHWFPMKKENFISSGNVWFDYELKAYRIDGLFNPWDVEKMGYQLWMSEICLYGQGINYKYTLPYHIQHLSGISEYNYQVSEIKASEVDADVSILPQDILVLGKAELKATKKLLGFDVDCWEFDKENVFNITCFYLKTGKNELVRMEQIKNGQLLIRDFPNLSTEKIDKEVFTPRGSNKQNEYTAFS